MILLFNSGVPDSPLQCMLRDIANTTAVILCYAGYSGGQEVSYVVVKAGMFSPINSYVSFLLCRW